VSSLIKYQNNILSIVSFKCKKYQIYVTSSEVDSEYKHVYHTQRV